LNNSLKIQKSFAKSNLGSLYLVATPIGNLQDITLRAKETLTNVDLILTEDTRITKRLLNSLNIKKTLLSYHKFNETIKTKKVIAFLLEKKNIALVSNAGFPNISDPGYILVQEALKNEIPVIPIPGANAFTTALVASGLPTAPSIFLGFLPKKSSKRKTELLKYKDFFSNSLTFIIYEAPYRLENTLKDIYEIFGNCDIVISRELIKRRNNSYI